MVFPRSPQVPAGPKNSVENELKKAEFLTMTGLKNKTFHIGDWKEQMFRYYSLEDVVQFQYDRRNYDRSCPQHPIMYPPPLARRSGNLC